MRNNHLLYSDQSEVEELNAVEPAKKEKRSFLFYFIVFANLLLLLLVLALVWIFIFKSPNTSFDQQIKTWSQQLFSTSENTVKATPVATKITIDLQAEQVAAKEKALEQLRIENERLEKEAALKAEQDRLEILAAELKQEKDKADELQRALNETKSVVASEDTKPEQSINTVLDEAAVVPNAARDIPPEPDHTAQTALEKILEEMKEQKQ